MASLPGNALAENVAANAASAQATELESLTVVAGTEKRRAIDTLGSVSTITIDTMGRMSPSNTSALFAMTPGLSMSPAGEDASSVVNVRGLQDNGRVLVLVDGARQDFSRPTHAGYGSFYLDPDILRSVTVLRGPSAVGGGNIGGVISFETLAPKDLLGSDDWAVRQKIGYETNGVTWLSSTTLAARPAEKISLLFNFVARENGDYTDGDDKKIRLSGQEPRSLLAKIAINPLPDHEITLAATGYRNNYFASRMAGSSSATLSVDKSVALNKALTGRWTYRPQNNPWIDFVANAYVNKTEVDQVKVGGSAPLGTTRGYNVRTWGVNAFNSSRFDVSDLKNIVTLGADTATNNAKAYGDASAAVGEQLTSGAYIQLESNYSNWLQFVGSVRYNYYKLTGLNRLVTPNVTATPSESKITTRATLGVTPIEGLTGYVTHAEGFRPPAIYEVFGIYAGGNANNPSLQLKAEQAKSWEAGINFEKRNLFGTGDVVQLKVNGFRTSIEGYITGRNLAGNTKFYNLRSAKLEGFELEGSYNAAWGFLAVSGSKIDSYREGEAIQGTTAAAAPIPIDGVPISTAPLNRFSVSAGLNALGGKLNYGAMYIHVSETERRTLSFLTYPPNPAYDLVNLFASYQLNRVVQVRFNVDNLLDKAYSDPQAQYAVTAPTSFQGRGRTFKVNFVARFGG